MAIPDRQSMPESQRPGCETRRLRARFADWLGPAELAHRLRDVLLTLFPGARTLKNHHRPGTSGALFVHARGVMKLITCVIRPERLAAVKDCLLYTSDAADE